jgi:hypothetical protein
MSEINQLTISTPPNINDLLKVHTDLSKLNTGISDILFILPGGNTPSLLVMKEKSRKLKEECANIIQQINEKHEETKTYVQSLEKESDIHKIAEQILVKLKNTLKNAQKMENMLIMASKSIEKVENCEKTEKSDKNAKDLFAEDYLFEAKGRYHFAETLIHQYIQNAINSICSLLKNISRVINFR